MWEPYLSVEGLGFNGRTVGPPTEEDEAYFTGDRGAAETASVIQKRIRLMLEEM